jgi:hypothetical protein
VTTRGGHPRYETNNWSRGVGEWVLFRGAWTCDGHPYSVPTFTTQAVRQKPQPGGLAVRYALAITSETSSWRAGADYVLVALPATTAGRRALERTGTSATTALLPVLVRSRS